jgi:hypothetical protein
MVWSQQKGLLQHDYMSDDTNSTVSTQIGRLLAIMLNSPWVAMAADLWSLARRLTRGMADEGMYEVVDYDSTLELVDTRGERARVRKREEVRYVQDNIIAYQDQAWGDGDILVNYRCTPGVPVDQYRPGQTTYILISLREVKNRGDADEFNMTWDIRRGFLRPVELWAAQVNHKMRHLAIHVIFPRGRPPLRAWLIETDRQKTTPLEQGAGVLQPDGRRLISWDTDQPRLHETYSLKWEW